MMDRDKRWRSVITQLRAIEVCTRVAIEEIVALRAEEASETGSPCIEPQHGGDNAPG